MTFGIVARNIVPLQHKLLFLIMAFGRFNLYANSYSFLFKKAFDTRRARGGGGAWALEIVGLCFFWWWYVRVLLGAGLWGKALPYVLVSHVVTSPLHVQVSGPTCHCFATVLPS